MRRVTSGMMLIRHGVCAGFTLHHATMMSLANGDDLGGGSQRSGLDEKDYATWRTSLLEARDYGCGAATMIWNL